MKIGTKVKIIDAGEGAWAANGYEGIIVSKREAISSNDYGGEWRGVRGRRTYVKLTILRKTRTEASPALYMGLCPGHKLRRIKES